MTAVEGVRLALGAASLSATVYYRRRGQGTFNRFLVVWLMLVIGVVIVGEVFIRMNWPGAYLFKP